MRQFVARGKEQLERTATVIAGLAPDKPWRVLVSPYRNKRSPEQNKLLWAIYTEMVQGTGHTPEELHDAMKKKFLAPKFITVGDEQVAIIPDSSTLDVKEFSEFVERVQAFAAQELGVVV